MDRRQKALLEKVIKWAILIVVIVVVGQKLKDFIAPEVTDVTNMVHLEKGDLERTLDIELTPNSDKVRQIYEWSEGEVTVDSDDDIAVVYIDGKQMGLHIDGRKYSMYGLHMGDAMISVDRLTTFEYDGVFHVINDDFVGYSTAYYYYDEKNNDCLVVICNDKSGRVVALTYYNDFNKVTEQLDR